MKNNIYLKLGKDWLLNCPIEGRKSFRMTVVIKKNVNEKILRKAALDLSARLPKFSVRIKRGIIRDYFIYAEDVRIYILLMIYQENRNLKIAI